uniref:Uncharacterized protein n=1 Tax=Lotus japonicus TaxID=34305 RepID=I3S2X7_LOTJA|nr:unknown [Lotus japonicus]
MDIILKLIACIIFNSRHHHLHLHMLHRSDDLHTQHGLCLCLCLVQRLCPAEAFHPLMMQQQQYGWLLVCHQTLLLSHDSPFLLLWCFNLSQINSCTAPFIYMI